MANARQPKRPQLDYYEYKRQREDRLRQRAEAEGREWTPPAEPEEREYDSAPEERGAGFGAKALGALGGLGSRLKGAVSRKPDPFDDFDGDAAEEPTESTPIEMPIVDAPGFPQTEAAAPKADFQPDPEEEPTERAPIEMPIVDAPGFPQTETAASSEDSAPVDLPESAERVSQPDKPEEGPDTEPQDDSDTEPQDASDAEPQDDSDAESDDASDTEPQDDSDAESDDASDAEPDGNEDNPFSAFLRAASLVGGKARDLVGGLRARAAEKREGGADRPRARLFSAGEDDAEDELRFEDAPAQPDGAASADIADNTPQTDAPESPAADLFFAGEEEPDDARPGKGGWLQKLKRMLPARPGANASETAEDAWDDEPRDEDSEDDGLDAPPAAPNAYDKPDFAAADAPAYKEEPPMNEQDTQKGGSLSELLARELDDAPVLSRRERKALEAKKQAETAEPQPQDAAAPAPAPRFAPPSGVDEPTMEFTPIRARDTNARLAPVSAAKPRDDEDDDEDEDEAPKPARKGLFGRARKPARDDEDDDEDDEDEDDSDDRPARSARRSRYDEDDDEDEDDEEDEEDVRPRGKAARHSRYDDEDDDDDYDDDDYDDDRPGAGKGFLRFLRGLLILVIIGALVILGLRELEKRDVLSMDSLRGLGAPFGSIAETVFPDPDAAPESVVPHA